MEIFGLVLIDFGPDSLFFFLDQYFGDGDVRPLLHDIGLSLLFFFLSNTREKSALKKFSKRFLKDGSIGNDCSIQTPFATLMIGRPKVIPSAKTNEAITLKIAFSSSMEKDLRKERTTPESESQPGPETIMVSAVFIDADEKTLLERLATVEKRCHEEIIAESFCFFIASCTFMAEFDMLHKR
ncbi:unnamed protein product [Arabis nemorensis]|uniref:Uncharacterized protein n=1 Tax=Arabis nemorensis TaxID=586526 RepID=A0A565BEF1_9BRAS|nr:unnamed protein product [Arabis nemorensis]